MRCMSRTNKGFTLIEIVVVAPLVILLVGAIISAIIFSVDSAVRSQAKTKLQLDVLNTLDRIEQDIRLSTVVKDSTSSQVRLTNLATSENPLSPTRSLIKSSDCSVAGGGISVDEVLTYQITYSVVDGTKLIRRINRDGCTTSSNVWQKHGSASDETLVADSQSVSLSVTRDPDTSSAVALRVRLTVVRKSGSRDISYTGYLYAKSANL